ncbi:MAG: hypothetical protein ACI857_001160 [Arenicella sp.]
MIISLELNNKNRLKTDISIKKTLIGFGILLCCMLCNTQVFAILDLEYVDTIGEIKIYKDYDNKDQYYYSPGGILISENNEGKPEFKFLQMRYSGSAATGDKGKFLFKSILQVAVNFQTVKALELDAIRMAMGTNENARFSPLPISDVNAFLVYAAVDDSNNSGQINGQIENNENGEGDGGLSTWQKKTFTVSLDNATSQLFWDALESGNTIISFSYEYHSLCHLRESEAMLSVSSTGLDSDSLTDVFTPNKEATDSLSIKETNQLVYANSSALNFDAKKYPDLLVKIDINESRVPPDFAVLEVRCYDFNNKDTDDLYAKSIEIEATGMNNKTVKQKVAFYSYDNSYYHSIHFPYAVKMNLPYKYRVIEIREDGSRSYSKWTTQKSWTKLIDITTYNN